MLLIDLFAQRDAIDELHGNEVHAVTLTNLVNMGDVRMIERSSGFCLLHKPSHPILIRSKLGRPNLERDFPIERGIVRQIYFAHPTFSDLGDDAVMRQSCTG